MNATATATTMSRPASTSGSELIALRGWQRRAMVRYLSSRPRDFLMVATPGAGKTTFALRIAAELLADATIDNITIVVPTEHLKMQWAHAAAGHGIALGPRYSNATARTSSDYHGVVVTYAQVASHPARHRTRTEDTRTLVIFDEIHHGGDNKSWGEAIREAFTDATRRLSLTGTPFRSDDNPIPFITYERDRSGAMRSACDASYDYPAALADGVVRPVVFLAYSGEARWRDSAGEEHTARLGEPQTAARTARAWRTALDPGGEWIPAVLTAANTRLDQLRANGMADAGAMIIASDQKTARAYAALLTKLTGQAPTVVLSDDPTASTKIAQFATDTSRWLVAVRMVSEGVDIPRLAVGVYATSASTPLFFAQAIGRFVRSRRAGETASIFVPSVPALLKLAAELETQRDHVLDTPHRDNTTSEQTPARQSTEPAESQFESLGADAELHQVIYDGTSFDTAIPDTDTDYLGIPGLLDAAQMRDLLQRRSHQQHQTPSPPRSNTPTPTTHEQLRHLRHELNALVSAAHHRLNKPHGLIHNELRRICGGPPVSAATKDQLRARIDAVKTLGTHTH